MTAAELACLLNARKVGKNRWIAKCPAHPDRHPSLSISVGRRVPVLLKCMSQGCSTEAILDALGLKWGDLFDRESTSEARRRLRDPRKLERMKRRLCLGLWLHALGDQRTYWHSTVVRIQADARRMLAPEQWPAWSYVDYWNPPMILDAYNREWLEGRKTQFILSERGWDALADYLETREEDPSGKHT